MFSLCRHSKHAADTRIHNTTQGAYSNTAPVIYPSPRQDGKYVVYIVDCNGLFGGHPASPNAPSLVRRGWIAARTPPRAC